MDTQTLSNHVRAKYAQLATGDGSASSCCGADELCGVNNIMNESYEQLEGYVADADLGLGCGLPTAFAQIKKGDTVLDLGSGAGNDCFVARKEAGESGQVIGVDFTPEMVALAKKNADKMGYENVSFREGDITALPVNDATVDVVVSNCVLNLVAEKARVFAEMMRVMKPGAHFSISDIVTRGSMPEGLKQSAEAYAGCISGAIDADEYLLLIKEAGFTNIQVQKLRPIQLPETLQLQFAEANANIILKHADSGIFSLTVYAEKPAGKCCDTTCCN